MSQIWIILKEKLIKTTLSNKYISKTKLRYSHPITKLLDAIISNSIDRSLETYLIYSDYSTILPRFISLIYRTS